LNKIKIEKKNNRKKTHREISEDESFKSLNRLENLTHITSLEIEWCSNLNSLE
jgi:hypothetical protein